MTRTACAHLCHRIARHSWHHPILSRIAHHAATLPTVALACCAGAAWLAVPHLAAVPPPMPVAAPAAFEHAGLGAWYAPVGGYALDQVPLAGFGGAYASAGVPELPTVADLGSVPGLMPNSSGYFVSAYSGATSTYVAPASFVPAPMPTPVPIPEPSGLAVVAVALAGLAVVRRRA